MIMLLQGCDIEDLQHYHCKDDGCETVFRNEDGVREHGRNHFIQDQITEIAFLRGDPEESDSTPSKFHCKWVCEIKYVDCCFYIKNRINKFLCYKIFSEKVDSYEQDYVIEFLLK